tara:strand:- start:77 stop:523 length:447 start_codon:yes stop_codon:yes gene_type:complete
MVKDEIDCKIIELLQKNSRISYADLGRQINLSPSAVAERVQRMEDEKIIKKYFTVFNSKLIGFSISAYITMSFKDNGYKLFLNHIKEFPEIIECSRITGKDCLIMKLVLKDSSHLEEIVDKLCFYGTPSTSVVLSDVVSCGSMPVNFG